MWGSKDEQWKRVTLEKQAYFIHAAYMLWVIMWNILF